MGVETDGISGVYPALEYLTAATRGLLVKTSGAVDARGAHVVIVGNGDTATDCVATALRQGAASVVQLVRKPRPEDRPRVWPYPNPGEKTDYGQEEAAARFGQLVDSLALPAPAAKAEDLPVLCRGVNPVRLKNFPARLEGEDIEEVYQQILFGVREA